MQYDRFGDPLPPGAVARLGTLRYRHPGAQKILFMGNGDICSVAADSIMVWDRQTHQAKNTLRANCTDVSDVPLDASLSTCDRYLIVGCLHSVRVWDLVKSALRWDKSRNNVVGVGFLSDNNTAVVAVQSGAIEAVERATGKRIHQDKMRRGSVAAMRCSVTGPEAFVGFQTGTIISYDPLNGSVNWSASGEISSIAQLATSPDGEWIISTGDDFVEFWNIGSHTNVHCWRMPSTGSYCEVSAASDLVAVGTESGKIFLGKVGEESFPKVIESSDHSSGALALSKDGQNLASVLSGKISVWSVEQGADLSFAWQTPGVIDGLAISPCGKWVALAGDSRFGVWDWQSGVPSKFRSNHRKIASSAMAFSPDNKYLASGGWDNTVRLYRVTDWSELVCFEGHKSRITSLSFSPDSMHLASGDPDSFPTTIRIWDVTGKTLWKNIEGPSLGDELASGHFSSRRVCFSPNPNVESLFTAGSASSELGCNIFVWRWTSDPPTYDVLYEGNPDTAGFVRCLTCSNSGLFVAVGSQHPVILLFDLSRSGHVSRIDGQIADTLAFSPDDRLLATGGTDSIVHIWDVATGREVKRLEGHLSSVTGLAFTPDGTKLLSSSRDTTVLVWDLG